MKKRYASWLVLLCFGFLASYGQGEEPDTTTVAQKEHELKDVVVEGESQRFTSGGALYIPTAAQKKTSISGVDLLARMGIPQIKAVPGGEDVTDNFGNPVEIFINYLPASRDEVNGMMTTDVKSVEYLEYPVDPRFRGAAKVINFIVRRYEYGGYTKLSLNEMALVGLSSRAGVFSKLAYKNVTFDLFAEASNWNFHNCATERNTILFPGRAEATRREAPDDSHRIQANYPVSLRVTYANDRVSLRNMLRYSHWNLGKDFSQGSVTTTFAGIPQSNVLSYTRNAPEIENSLRYDGDWYFILPHQFSLALYPVFQYSRTNSFFNYLSTEPLDIERNATDRMLWTDVQAWLQKNFGNAHALSLKLEYMNQNTKTDFSGSAAYSNRYNANRWLAQLGYSFQTRNLSLSARAGAEGTLYDMNGARINEASPLAQVYARWYPDNRNALEAYIYYHLTTLGPSKRVPETFRENELLFYAGNPDLKGGPQLNANLSYGLMASKVFRISLFGQQNSYFNKVTTFYSPMFGTTGVTRYFHNDGNYHQTTAGLSLSLTLLNRALQISAAPEYTFHATTGQYSRNLNTFAISASATYYIKNFYISAYFRNPTKSFDYVTNQVTTGIPDYYLMAGWGNGDWNVRLTAYRIFRYSWDYSHTEISMPEIMDTSILSGQAGHAALALNVAYTFGYGKKIGRDSEIGGFNRASTGILKE